MKLLIVDDASFTRYVLRKMLEIAGYEVLEAATIEDGMNTLQSEKIDLVITDLMMPDGDGMAFLESGMDVAMVPFFLITAAQDEKVLKKARACGFAEVLTKPINNKEMLLLLKKHLPENSDSQVRLQKFTVSIESRAVEQATLAAGKCNMSVEEYLSSMLNQKLLENGGAGA
jgi:DNA-binding response OmpR family regulator